MSEPGVVWTIVSLDLAGHHSRDLWPGPLLERDKKTRPVLGRAAEGTRGLYLCEFTAALLCGFEGVMG